MSLSPTATAQTWTPPAPARLQPVAERGLEIIQTLRRRAPRQTVSEVAAKTGLTRATARRFLMTLVELGYMTTDGRTFQLAPRVLGLGYSFLSGLGFPNVALPHLERLVAEVDESSEASILDGARCRLRRSASRHEADDDRRQRRLADAGARDIDGTRAARRSADDQNSSATSSPRTLQQFLPRTATDRGRRCGSDRLGARADGYAIIDQELEEGLIAVAVPIHDRLQRVVAAVNLSTHVGRHDVESLRNELLPPLQRARGTDRARPRERGVRSGPVAWPAGRQPSASLSSGSR